MSPSVSSGLASVDLAGLVMLLAIGFAIVWIACVWFTAHRLRRPPRRTAAWAASRGAAADPGELSAPIPFTAKTVELAGDPVELWEIEGRDPSGPVVVMTPGWGDSKIGALPRLEAIIDRASLVVAWDPPGAGESPGLSSLGAHEPERLGELVDRYMNDRGAALWGWSLGGGVSIATAAARPAGIVGVIAEAPYRRPETPARNVLRLAGLPWRLNLRPALAILGVRLGVGPRWRGFDRAEAASRLDAPLLVIHGADDDISPLEDGRSIAETAAAGELVEIPGAGHNDLWTESSHRERCLAACREFIGRLTGSPAASRG